MPFLVLLLALLLSLPGEASPRIPQGNEAKTMALFEPVAFNKPLEGGWELSGISIDRDLIRLEFSGPADARATLQAHHPDSAVEGRRLGPVKLSGEAPEPILKALEAALVSKTAADLPWVNMAPTAKPERGHQSGFSGWDRKFVLFSLWALAGLLLLGGIRHSARLRRHGRGVGGVVLVTLAGLLLRTFLSPREFLHEYYHINDHLSGYLFRTPGTFFFYGETGPVLYSFANLIHGGDEQAVFTANTVLSTLTIPVVAALALVLYGRWSGALIAAAVYAALPINLRFAASEDLAIPGVFFATLGLTAALRFQKSGTWLSALIAGLATLLTMHSRPELMAWPLAILLVLVSVSGKDSLRRLLTAPALVAGLILLVSCTRRALELAGGQQGGFSGELAQFFKLAAWLDPNATPPVFTLLLFLGVLVSLVRKHWVGLALFAVSCGYVLLTLSIFSNPPPYNLRTQLIVYPGSLMLVLVGLSFLKQVLERYSPPWGLKLLAALLVVSFAWPLTKTQWIQETGDAQQEWAFLLKAVPELPRAPGVLLTLRRDSRLASFPEFLLARNGIALKPVRLPTGEERAEWPEDEFLVFYQGMYCHSALEASEFQGAMTRLCAQVHERYHLEPLVSARIPGPGYSRMHYAPAPYEIGFYRLTKRATEKDPVHAGAPPDKPASVR